MHIVAIVQARMTSARLPGKVLRPIRGKPMLQYIIDRLSRAKGLDATIVATSTDSTDDDILRFCGDANVACVRGSLDDVASRFLAALDAHPADAFVRISADSPLLDPAVVEAALALYGDHVDMVTNKTPKTFPSGQSVEIVNASVFRSALPRFLAGSDREHVTPFFYRHADEFEIRGLTSPVDLGAVHMAVDTLEDFERCSAIIGAMNDEPWSYGLDELVQLSAALPPETVRQ